MFPLTVALNAGGQSTRMGTDKALVRLTTRPLIEELLAGLEGLGQETLLITNRPEAYSHLGVPLLTDARPGAGALGGIYTALQAATQPHVLCLACDMPFLVRPLLEYLIRLRLEADVVMPRLNQEAEPFRAVYSQACLPAISAALDRQRLRIISFLPDVRVRYVDEGELDPFDPHHRTFFNVNTPADLEKARQMAQESST